MFDYKLSSVEVLSENWDNICLNIFNILNEVEERINKEKYTSDEELDKDEELELLEALYDEISGTVDFDHLEEIVAYIQNENS